MKAAVSVLILPFLPKCEEMVMTGNFVSEIDGSLLEATRCETKGDIAISKYKWGTLIVGIRGNCGDWEVWVNNQWVDRSVDTYPVVRGDQIYWEGRIR